MPIRPVPARDAGDPDVPGWRRPPLTVDQYRADQFLAAGMFVGAVLSMVLWQVAGLYDEPAPAWASVLCLAGVTAPLAVRRRWPSAVLVVVAAFSIAAAELYVPEGLFVNISLFAALYTVGAWEADRRRAAVVRVTVIAAMFVWLLIALYVSTSDPDSLPDLSRAGAFSPLVAYLLIQLLTNVLYFAGAYWFGERSWASAGERARTEMRTRQLEQERRRVAAQAVSLERLRLARELHDAVAHHVSMMGVHAAAARTLLGTDAERAATTLEQVEDSAREAIEELHGILGTLREEPDGPDVVPETGREARPDASGAAGHDASGGIGPDASGGIGPDANRATGHDANRATGHAPSGYRTTEATDEAVASLDVARIPELVAQACKVGLPATYQVLGDPVRLPPLTSLNLYRIAQEALTNTRKHAGPYATADVRLRYLTDAVELEVADDGVGRPVGMAGMPDGEGLGLVGIRERVGADGGTLVAGPRSRGGFLVRARIPLDRRDGSDG